MLNRWSDGGTNMNKSMHQGRNLTPAFILETNNFLKENHYRISLRVINRILVEFKMLLQSQCN